MLKTFSEQISTGDNFLAYQDPSQLIGKKRYVQPIIEVKGIKLEYLGKQRLGKGQSPVSLYNVVSPKHPAYKSTITAKTLKEKYGLDITKAKFTAKPKIFIKSAAKKLAKYLISKEGLRLTAKTTAKIAWKFSKFLSLNPYLAPLIWAPEIYDLATAKATKALWKEIVKATPEIKKQRMKGLVELEKTRAGVYGEYYHSSVGWY